MGGLDSRESLAQEFPELISRLKERDDCSPLHDPDVYSIITETHKRYREDGTEGHALNDLERITEWSSKKGRGRQKAEILVKEGWFTEEVRNGETYYQTNIPPEKPSKRATIRNGDWLPMSLKHQRKFKRPIQERLPNCAGAPNQVISKVEQARNIGNSVFAAESSAESTGVHKQQADYSIKLIQTFSFLGFLSLLAGAVFFAAVATAGFFAGVSLLISAQLLKAVSARRVSS